MKSPIATMLRHQRPGDRTAPPLAAPAASRSAATTRLQCAILRPPRIATWREVAEDAWRAGADLDATVSHGGKTLLTYVCTHGPLSVVRWLLEHGANPNVGTRNDSKPLIVAAEHRRVKTVRLLLEHGADPNAADKNGWTALLASACADSTEAVCLLLEHGAAIDAARTLGDTPLMLAAQHAATRAARLLLDQGADPNATNHRGRTALMLAAIRGNIEAVRLLIDRKPTLEARDRDGCTALAWAVWNLQLPTAILLIERGADPNARNQNGNTILAMASRRARPGELIPFFGPLFAAGADPSLTDAADLTLPEMLMERNLVNLVQAMDTELARPTLAATRRRLLDRLTAKQRMSWLPKSCTAECAERTAKTWSRQP